MRFGLRKLTSVAISATGFCIAITCFAGTPQKWADLPKAVQKTVLDNGGTSGTTVDKENNKINNLAVYEAGIKDKDGIVRDLVITEDGKLIETKSDDAADLT